jgi:hypothetical protein
MSILWSIIPTDILFASNGKADEVELQELQLGHATMVVSPAQFGMAKIERLISPNPRDYLKPEWQPGALIPYTDFTHNA